MKSLFHFIFALCLLQLGARADWPPLAKLVKEAERGDLEAKVALAFRNFHSQGNSRDPELIYQAFAEGAEAGFSDAYAGLALCQSLGFGTRKDPFEAYRLARLSADLGSHQGYLALGKIAMTGTPFPALRKRIPEFFSKAAAMGNLQADYYLATYQFEENGFSQVTVDPEALERLAGQGHEAAIYHLSQYYRGKNDTKASRYFDRALEMNIPEALDWNAFEDPEYQDFETRNTRAENLRAIEHYRRAAARGDRKAIFSYGYGLFLHPELAREGEDWREIVAESARLGHTFSCEILGWSYYKPTTPGVDPDYAKAEDFLIRTVDFPKMGRYQTLGLMYADGGHGLEKNPERAFRLLKRYANGGPFAYRILGRILTDWEPLRGKDAYKIRAYACYLRYQELVPEPREGLFEERTHALGLTAAQIAKARKLADDGYPSKPEHTLWLDDDGPYGADNLAQDAVAAYRSDGPAAMKKLLTDRLDEFHLANPRGPHLFRSNQTRFLRLFREAQLGAGREDPFFAVALYEWLYQHVDDYPVSMSRSVILNNYYLSLSQTGQRARARNLLSQASEAYAFEGLIGEQIKHPESSPFPKFPEIKVPDYRDVTPITLNRADWIRLLARQSLVEGNWQHSLSRAKAGFDLVEHMLKNTGALPHQEGEWASRLLRNRTQIAETFELLEFRREADARHLANVQSQRADTYQGRSRLLGKLSLERNRTLRGKATAETVRQLKTLVQDASKHPFLSRQDQLDARHALILALFATGQETTAWPQLEKARQEAPHHLPLLLLWVEQRIRLHQLGGLEDLLIKQLTKARKQGEKVSETQLYLHYARYLKACGRLDEAARMQVEAIRLLRSFDLYTLLPAAQLELAELFARAGNVIDARQARGEADRLLNSGRPFPEDLLKDARDLLQSPLPAVEKDESPEPQIDLQPRTVTGVPLKGFPAHGLFLLKNPSRASANGQFQVTGNHSTLKATEAPDFFEITVDPAGFNSKTSALNLTLQAGEMFLFQVSTLNSDFNQPGELQLSWIPEKGPSLQARWSYAPPGDRNEQRSVVDAGVYVDNPFYSVPIYHLIQSQIPLSRPIDLKVMASQAARIEAYNERNELVFVDHNGNGSLNDPGDILASDANADGHGDLMVDREGARTTVFYLLITPKEALPNEGLELHVQDRDDPGQWKTVSRDLLLPGGD